MKYYGKNSLAFVLKIVMDLLLILGPLTFIFIFVSSIREGKGDLINFKAMFIGTLYVIGGLSLLSILYNLRNIVASLVTGTPFIIKNVYRLIYIAISCFLVAVCYVLNILVNKQYKNFKLIFIDASGIHTDIEFLIFFFTGCFMLILSKVFKQAVEYKEEHDFTI